MSLILIISFSAIFFTIGQQKSKQLTIEIAQKHSIGLAKQLVNIISKDFIKPSSKNGNNIDFEIPIVIYNLHNKLLYYFKNQNILRIILYDKNKKIIYSSYPELIGRISHDNKNVQYAIEGNITSLIIDKKIKNEYLINDKNIYEQIIETYIPIELSNNGIPSNGVAEIYMDMSYYEKQLLKLNLESSIIIIIGSIIFYILLLLIIIRIDIKRDQAEFRIEQAYKDLDKQIKKRTLGLLETKKILENEIIARETIEEKLKKSEDDLETSLQICQAVSNISPNSHIISNSKGVILQINPSTNKIFGYNKNELIGKHVSILSPSYLHDKYSQFIFNYHEFKRSGKQEKRKNIRVPEDCKAMSKNGKVFPIMIYIKESIIKKDEYFVCIIEDVKNKLKI